LFCYDHFINNNDMNSHKKWNELLCIVMNLWSFVILANIASAVMFSLAVGSKYGVWLCYAQYA
jgi:hypothetical protein